MQAPIIAVDMTWSGEQPSELRRLVTMLYSVAWRCIATNNYDGRYGIGLHGQENIDAARCLTGVHLRGHDFDINIWDADEIHGASATFIIYMSREAAQDVERLAEEMGIEYEPHIIEVPEYMLKPKSAG